MWSARAPVSPGADHHRGTRACRAWTWTYPTPSTTRRSPRPSRSRAPARAPRSPRRSSSSRAPRSLTGPPRSPTSRRTAASCTWAEGTRSPRRARPSSPAAGQAPDRRAAPGTGLVASGGRDAAFTCSRSRCSGAPIPVFTSPRSRRSRARDPGVHEGAKSAQGLAHDVSVIFFATLRWESSRMVCPSPAGGVQDASHGRAAPARVSEGVRLELQGVGGPRRRKVRSCRSYRLAFRLPTVSPGSRAGSSAMDGFRSYQDGDICLRRSDITELGPGRTEMPSRLGAVSKRLGRRREAAATTLWSHPGPASQQVCGGWLAAVGGMSLALLDDHVDRGPRISLL